MEGQSSTKRWYVAQTHIRAECKALSHLRRQGFSTYLPQYLKRRRHARRTDWVPRPLFPRYIFIEMDLHCTRWRAIRSTVGITDLVCHGDRPAPVPPGVVDDIRRREDTKGMIAVAREARFATGDVVRITAGPLAEQVALFQRASDEERVILLLDMLGRRMSVEVPEDSIASFG